MSTTLDTVLWVIIPYVCLAIFVGGHVWRYRYDKFGWTTRSSQLYESRLLRWGSPLFHFGILAVFLGHVMGLGVPKRWTEAVGVSEGLYHFMAVSVGAVAGACTIVGMAILIYRRRTTGPVFSATTRMDKFMYVVLAGVIVLGLWNTVVANVIGHYDYREGVSVWFRGIFRFDLHPELMAEAPIGFQLHGLLAFGLFALWPFTRLVHAFSAPIGYLWRPYIVYRSKRERLGSRSSSRGMGAGPLNHVRSRRRAQDPFVCKRAPGWASCQAWIDRSQASPSRAVSEAGNRPSSSFLMCSDSSPIAARISSRSFLRARSARVSSASSSRCSRTRASM